MENDKSLDTGGVPVFKYWDMHLENSQACFNCGLTDCVFDEGCLPDVICPGGFFTDKQRKMTRKERDQAARDRGTIKALTTIRDKVEPMLPCKTVKICKAIGVHKTTIRNWINKGFLIAGGGGRGKPWTITGVDYQGYFDDPIIKDDEIIVIGASEF